MISPASRNVLRRVRIKPKGNCLKAKIQILFLALSCLAGSARAAVTLTITPSAISNNYGGVITLDITGLASGEQVSVQKYFDFNGNGMMDPGEPMVDAFKIKDGGANVIGGVTNINVPFDSNSGTGAITTTLDFAPPRVLANTVGQYVIRVSSPSNNFSPVTAPFTVTNAALAQSLSGIIYSNGVTPLPNAVVVALEPSGSGNGNGSYAAAAMTDSAGRYQLNLPPGSYAIMPVAPGYYTDQSLAPLAVLGSGMAVTNDLYLTNGAVTVSGSVYDATNLTALGGVMVNLDSDNYFAAAFTDTNGSYSAVVAPGPWKVKVESDQIARRAYVVSQNRIQVDTTTGSVANVNLALPKATAMFFGRIADTNSAPFPNIRFSASDEAGQFEASGFSAGSGKYCVAVLGGTNIWRCYPDTSSQPLSSCILSSVSDTNILPGQALPLNFTAIPVSAQISGHLQDNLGHALANVGINAGATIGGIQFGGYADTDADGNYSLLAVAGVWNVNVNCCGNDGLSNYGLVDTNSHVVAIPPTNAVLNITVAPPGPLSFSGGALAGGYENDSYVFSLSPSGGSPPYSFSFAPASGPLPPGLSLNSNGFISGTPTTNGTFDFSIRVTDQTTQVDAACSITILPRLQVLTTSLTNGAVGVSYSVQLEAAGGNFPYHWYLTTNSSSLPPGLMLTTNGLLSGIPGVAGTYNLVVQVYDSSYHTLTQALPFVITTTNQPPPGMLLSAPAQNPDGSFQFGFMSAPGTHYTIQYSSNLYTWTSVLTFQSPGGSLLVVDPNAVGNSQRFYRVKIGP